MGSQKKCSWTLVFVAAYVMFVLLPSSIDAEDSTRQRMNGAGDKIMYGTDAKRNEFPFVVYSKWALNPHVCTGSLIDRYWVLTAGHCIGYAAKVVLGDYIRPGKDGNEQVIRIEKGITHPEYSAIRLDKVVVKLNNDVGLIRLREPANISSDAVAKISPLKSKSFVKKMRANEKSCWTVGWGITNDPVIGHYVTDRLKKMRTNFVNETEDAARGYSTYLSEGAMGVEADYKDNSCKRGSACYGDSGSPVVCKQKGEWVVTGVVSFGNFLDDCITGVFGVVNIQLYYDWIQDTINSYTPE